MWSWSLCKGTGHDLIDAYRDITSVQADLFTEHRLDKNLPCQQFG
jgi:hypothetical protein